MKRIKFLTFILLCVLAAPAMAQVTIIINQLPANTPTQDSIYLASDSNNWNPGDPDYVLHKNGQGKWEITLGAQPDLTSIHYKFTRGSWATVEKGALGEELPNRVLTFGNGDTIPVIIYNWADNSTGVSTAAANVSVIKEDFFMPQLNRYRKIWLYFPPGYESSGLYYPVIYMHDGQNLFDASTSYAGEWEVDETLNTLASQGYQVPLVVGIDNGGNDRIGEYTPWWNPLYGGGDGDKYIQFIVETLKPYIDQNYRTMTDRSNTALMGSSLGGLISHYGGLKYQDVFSKAGLFSPSYWFSDSIWSFTHQTGKQGEMRFYQLCGSLEGAEMTDEMQWMNDSLCKIGFTQNSIFNKVVAGGEHNENLWREAFGDAYMWLFNSFANGINAYDINEKIHVYPNPVYDFLTLKGAGNYACDSLEIIDIKGGQVKSFAFTKNCVIDVHKLAAGIYILKFTIGDIVHGVRFIKK